MDNIKNYTKISCKGYNEASPHPKIYLLIENTNKEVNCPYCFKKYNFNMIESKNENN